MTIKRLFAILFIYLCTAFAWFLLGGALTFRTNQAGFASSGAVADTWGPAMQQAHPTAYYQNPGSRNGRTTIRPSRSEVTVKLQSDPKQKGLIKYRGYHVDFSGTYVFDNPTPIPQTIYVQFALPSKEATYTQFSFLLNGQPTTADLADAVAFTEAVTLQPGEKATLKAAYQTRGLDSWGYSFGAESRLQNFLLHMETDFTEINFPNGTGSPSNRHATATGWTLNWEYPDEIGARSIGMDMPKVLNPGPTAERITYFAPVSLLFFFSVLIILCILQRQDVHPMNFFFLGAGCFAFQLLFAYLVDLVPIGLAFAISALVSLVLVSGYLLLACGIRFARLAALAQFCYMILFSLSFFLDGFTGLTITIGAISTLAILMATTARINWTEKFSRPPKHLTPPPVPRSAAL